LLGDGWPGGSQLLLYSERGTAGRTDGFSFYGHRHLNDIRMALPLTLSVCPILYGLTRYAPTPYE